jgi:hypothetical protein
VRLLAKILEDAGYGDTAATLTEAIRLEVMEPPLTLDDYQAMLRALGDHCPTGLAKLRRQLRDFDMKRRLAGQ